MPPKAKVAGRWGEEHIAAIIKCFKDTKLGWDPAETSRPKIKAFLKNAPPDVLALIQPHFSINDGGTKGNNGTLYGHYKDIWCEFIVEQTRAGIRRKDAAYLNNNNLSGARKRSAKEEAGEEESTSFPGSITLGSEDTTPSPMKSPPASAAKAGAAAAAADPPAPAPSVKTSDVEMLAHRMDKMKITEQQVWGCNFNCPHPHYWWTFSVSGISYIKAEFLTWTVDPLEITCKLSADGTILYIGGKIPDRFLNINRQKGYYHNQPIVPEEGDVMFEGGQKAIHAIQQLHSMEQIKPLTRVKLPFAVQEDFHDPYRPMEKGYGLRSYPHETAHHPPQQPANPGDPIPPCAPHIFHVFHVCMQSKARAHVKTRVEYEHVNMGAGDFGEV